VLGSEAGDFIADDDWIALFNTKGPQGMAPWQCCTVGVQARAVIAKHLPRVCPVLSKVAQADRE
jgi:hypothetical protein